MDSQRSKRLDSVEIAENCAIPLAEIPNLFMVVIDKGDVKLPCPYKIGQNLYGYFSEGCLRLIELSTLYG